jgi:hypothetical protein
MKRTVSFFSILLSALAICAQSQVKHEVVYTILANESLLISESSAGLACEGGEICLTVFEASTKSFYVYRNGIKNGPYTKNQIAQYMCSNDVINLSPTAIDNVYLEPNITITEDGKVILNFKGRTYGPHTAISPVYYSSDANNFAAVVTDENLKSSIISSLGSEFKVEGNVENINFDASGTKFLITTTTQSEFDAIINAKMLEIAEREMSEEEIMKMISEINELEQSASDDDKASKSWVYTETGAKYGPYSENLYSYNPCFYKGDSKYWILISGNTLFINGKEIKSFPDMYPVTENVHISADGSKWAIRFYDKMVLWDGKEYPYPLYSTICNGNLVWINVLDNTKVIRYSVPF